MFGCLLSSVRHNSFSDCKLLYAADASTSQQKCADDLEFVEIHILL